MKATRRVLVVDDDLGIRSALHVALEDVGFDVHQASNGFSALRAAERIRPDLILLDLALPDISGPDVLIELRRMRSTRTVPVLVVTGRLSLVAAGGANGADAVLTKPFDIAELLTVVEQLVARRRHTAGAAPVPPLMPPRPAQPARSPGTYPTPSHHPDATL